MITGLCSPRRHSIDHLSTMDTALVTCMVWNSMVHLEYDVEEEGEEEGTIETRMGEPSKYECHYAFCKDRLPPTQHGAAPY